MRTFIIAAITADGFIARNSQHLANWTSPEDKKFFTQRTKEAKVLVMGLNTFRTIGKPLPDRRTIVYAPVEEKIEGVETTQETPQDLIARLEKEGYQELAICGGASIYTMFMEAGVVDTLYLTVEPLMFGAGIGLFAKELAVKLELKAVTPLSSQTTLLEYKVLKEK